MKETNTVDEKQTGTAAPVDEGQAPPAAPVDEGQAPPAAPVDEGTRVRFGTVTPIKRGRGRPKGSKTRKRQDDDDQVDDQAPQPAPAAPVRPSPNAVVYAQTLVKAIAAAAERYKMPLLEQEKQLMEFAYSRLIDKYNLTFSVEFEAAFITGCVIVPRVLAARKLAEQGLQAPPHA